MNKIKKYSKILAISLFLILLYLSLSGCLLFLIKQNKPNPDQTNNNQSSSTGSTQNSSLNTDIYFQTIDINQLKQIDEYSRNVPSNYENDIETLTKYLIKPAKTDLEKVRAIWVWITNNISYDVGGYFSGNISTYDAQTAFQKKMGVCSGYASLFKQMCNIANIKCEVITGYAKGYSYNPSMTSVTQSNHAWNAIYINNRWYLLDSTWGSGYVDYNRKFIKDYEEFYFCTNPSFLIYTHYPEDPKWQLLQKQYDSVSFLNLLYVWPLFFKLGLQPISHPYAKIETNSSNINIIFSVPFENVQLLSVSYFKNSGKEAVKPSFNVIKEANSFKWNFTFNFNSKDEYFIYIFAGHKGDTRFKSAAQYYVVLK